MEQQKTVLPIANLFVTNLNSEVDNETLRAELDLLFSRHGNVDHMAFKIGFPNKTYKYAFVTMDSQQAADRVIQQFNNYLLFGRYMLVTGQKDKDNGGKKHFTSVRPLLNKTAMPQKEESNYSKEHDSKHKSKHKREHSPHKKHKSKKHHKSSLDESLSEDSGSRRERSRDNFKPKKKDKHRKRLDSQDSRDSSVRKKTNRKKRKHSKRSDSSESEREFKRKHKKHHKYHRE